MSAPAPKFKFRVTRVKTYEAIVEAPNAQLAAQYAKEVGVDWRVVDDSVTGDVIGLDNAHQHMMPPTAFKKGQAKKK